MSVEKHLTYRGDIKAALGVGGTLVFVTAHPEGQATGLYRLDADALSLHADALPKGGTALAADAEILWVLGTDSRLYTVPAAGGKPKPLGPELDAPATALAPLADNRLAALVGAKVLILARKDGKVLQALDLPEPGTSLAADPTGRWLAAGTTRGTVAVFDAEGKPEFLLSASERLHEGAVSALLFEPDELRFLSAGADQKLFSTHARGKLEPEDKGRGNNHTDLVTALIWGPGDRLYSGSRDASIKSWPRIGAVKPATTKDGVGRVVALALVTVHDRPRLAAACDDNTIRIFPLDAAGKVGDCSHRVEDAYALARHELAQNDTSRREVALKLLAGYGDALAIALIAEQAGSDADHVLRLQAAQLLGASAHPRASTLLQAHLTHRDEAVRVAAFQGLRRQLGETDLKPIDLALKAEKADIGALAVKALESLAKRDDQALARLSDALDAKTVEVRQAAVVSLEAAHDPRSPEPNLVALGSKHADVRRLALLRLYRRGLLGDSAVQSALRRRLEDPSPDVRLTAFLLTLHTRERLLGALRSRDPDLQRQIAELEATPIDSETAGKIAAKVAGKLAAFFGKGVQDEADLDPLLQATASRALDTCLRGARGLAILGDPRAFGLLLQLSREDDKSARAWVCRALASLGDARAVERLRSLLHDGEAEVRDAAFTALEALHKADPLLAAESGLNASHEDVRRRGLQALTAELRKDPSSAPALALLTRALNDGAQSVRAEAFKSTLSILQPTALGTAGALRFAARSIHPEVRREVLNEATAQIGDPWGWDLLLEFFNDPDPALRNEAFGVAAKKTKGLEILDAGLGSRYADLRKRSVDELVKKHTAAAQALLFRALDDEDRDVRLAALGSLVAADAKPSLAQALENPHADVRLRAAKALARHGDPKALAPLVALATAPEPLEKERQADWLALAESALDGLGELGDPSPLLHLIPALDSPHAAIRKQAARALVWVARPGATDALRQALQHGDPEVKYHAALGLAYAGDASVSSLVFSDAAAKVLSVGERIAAALALGAAGEDRLVVFLDDANDQTRGRALLLLLMREWKDPQGTAARCLACLSSRTPRFRLTAARALEALSDPVAFAAFVTSLVNDRGDKPAWTIPGATVDALAELLVHGPSQLRARSARLLGRLSADEPHEFNQAWSIFEERFTADLDALRNQARKRKAVPLKSSPQQLLDLAFGAYVGLVREQGGAQDKKNAAPDPDVVRIRQSALARLLTLAKSDPHHAASAQPVFIQAMGDPNQGVRLQAFEQAQAVGVSTTALAAEALATGFTDLGVKGLELLTGGSSEEEAQAILEQAMLTRKDDLAVEAFKLLIDRRGAVAVATLALEAAHERLRIQAVSWIAGEYEKDPAASNALRKALESRYRLVREAAAFALAGKRDPAAFEALTAMLNAATLPVPQLRVAQAMLAIGNPLAPGVLLDRVENDPGGTANADALLKAVGLFRRPEIVERLLAFWDKFPKHREHVFGALLILSGYDQTIEDPEDERPDDRWLESQYPRRDEVLARLIDRVSAPADAKFLARLLPVARWARGKLVDPALAGLVNHPDENVRREVVRAIGWRLRKRGADREPLRKALGHRDPVTQFLAAEGLARAGRPDGLNVLLASIDFASDLQVRRGAVTALGELADERALDVLLKLAAEDAHALQDAAAEAIGHMSRSPRAEEVFQLLKRYAQGDGSIAQSALNGLRWFNTPTGWDLVRSRAADSGCPFREEAVELLGYDDEPATRDLLLRLLGGDGDFDDLDTAMTSARRLWGRDALEPAYAVLSNEYAEVVLDDFDELLTWVCERGEPRRLFELLTKCPDSAREALASGLLGRPELPVAEAKEAIGSREPVTAGVAARILGRAGKAAADAGPAVEAALAKWRMEWADKRKAFDDDSSLGMRLGNPLKACLQKLVWAAGRLGAAKDALIEIAGTPSDDPEFQPIRLEAVLALAAAEPTPKALAALEAAAQGGAPEVRAAAAQAIGRRDPARASALAGKLLSDRVSFERLTLAGGIAIDDTLRPAARQVHYQGVVLADLIDRKDVKTLAAVAEDRKLSEATRLGALEGLAAMALETAEDILRRVGTTPAEDEDLRKGALRGLRRSRRLRQKAETPKAKAKVKS